MATITGQINLLKLHNARRVQDGNIKGIFIPIYDNPAIYAEGRGAYLNIRIVEKESEYNGKKFSHFIAADLAKEKRDELRDRLSDDDFRAVTPILGNANAWDSNRHNNDYEQTTLTEPESLTPQPSDLPF